MNRVNATGQAGFTLLEVLVALAIIVIGIVSTMQLYPSSLLQARIAAERTVTAQTANSVFGEIRASSAKALFENQVPAELLSDPDASSLFGYRTTIQRLPGASGVYLQRVTLTVTFANGRRETFVTYVSRQ